VVLRLDQLTGSYRGSGLEGEICLPLEPSNRDGQVGIEFAWKSPSGAYGTGWWLVSEDGNVMRGCYRLGQGKHGLRSWICFRQVRWKAGDRLEIFADSCTDFKGNQLKSGTKGAILDINDNVIFAKFDDGNFTAIRRNKWTKLSKPESTLPPGWVEHKSLSQPNYIGDVGKPGVFYWHKTSGKTQWKFPSEAANLWREEKKQLSRKKWWEWLDAEDSADTFTHLPNYQHNILQSKPMPDPSPPDPSPMYSLYPSPTNNVYPSPTHSVYPSPMFRGASLPLTLGVLCTISD